MLLSLFRRQLFIVFALLWRAGHVRWIIREDLFPVDLYLHPHYRLPCKRNNEHLHQISESVYGFRPLPLRNVLMTAEPSPYQSSTLISFSNCISACRSTLLSNGVSLRSSRSFSSPKRSSSSQYVLFTVNLLFSRRFIEPMSLARA